MSKIVLFIAYLGFLLSRTVSIPIISSRTRFAALTPCLRVTIGHLRLTIGHLRVTKGHLRVRVGHPRVTVGHLRLTIGYLKAPVVHIRVT